MKESKKGKHSEHRSVKMKKIKIQLVEIGELNSNLNTKQALRFSSSIFEINKFFLKVDLPSKSKGLHWNYTDKQFRKIFPKKGKYDLSIGITDVPLEYNYYVRKINESAIVLSFCKTGEILTENEIPIENLLYRTLYQISLTYISNNSKFPKSIYEITHDDTRGCIFDMTGYREDLAHSTVSPIICKSCIVKLKDKGVTENLLRDISIELKYLRLPLISKLRNIIRKSPMISVTVTVVGSILLNILASATFKLIEISF